MIIRVIERVGNANIQNRIVRVIRVYDRNIPGGITVDTLTEAGSMIVASAASTPSETGAPSADGQAWVSDLAQPLKGRWQSVPTSASGSISLTNKSGSNQVAGTVVIFDKTNDQSFTTSNILYDRRIAGVLEEDIANNASGKLAVMGKIITVNVQGNVSRGYWLVQSTTTGRAAQYENVRPATGGIGIALTSYSGGGAGTVLALVDVDLYSTYLQIELLGSAATNSDTATSLSATHTLSNGANRIAFAIITLQTTQSVSGVTYGGVSMTRLGTGVAGSAEKMEIYYLLEASMPASGSKTVTATFSGSTDCMIEVFTIKNAKQSAPSTPVTNTSAGATYLSGNVTVSVEGSFSITGVFNRGGSNTFTHDAGQVEIADFNASVGSLTASYEEHNTAGTMTQGSTSSGSNRMLFMATVIEPI